MRIKKRNGAKLLSISEIRTNIRNEKWKETSASSWFLGKKPTRARRDRPAKPGSGSRRRHRAWASTPVTAAAGAWLRLPAESSGSVGPVRPGFYCGLLSGDRTGPGIMMPGTRRTVTRSRLIPQYAIRVLI